MKKTITIVLVLVLGLACVSLAVEGTWTTKSSMSAARYIPSVGVVDGKIYVIGGIRNMRAVSAVEEYLTV